MGMGHASGQAIQQAFGAWRGCASLFNAKSAKIIKMSAQPLNLIDAKAQGTCRSRTALLKIFALFALNNYPDLSAKPAAL
jgi:hypothetical protein